MDDDDDDDGHLVRVDEDVDGRGDAEEEVAELDDQPPPERLVLKLTIDNPLVALIDVHHRLKCFENKKMVMC